MNTEIQSFTDALLFVDGINKFNNNREIINFDVINELTNSFMKVHELENSKLPYHINILDVLWANENAHSRIFAKLLQQNSGNEFDVLNSFLKHLNGINSNFRYSPKKPKITSESDRIDLLILDKEYAIIIENKIHDAVDQGAQLARYIERVKQKGYKEEEIYVIYLTRDNNKKPDDQSWQFNGHDYKKSFAERYFSLSFKTNILPWLKNHALPNCKVKDVYLKSTIEQYIDYLEGMFNQRKIHKKMNSELQNHIKKVLELNESLEINHFKLDHKLSELVKVEDQIKYLIRSTEKDIWDEWLRRLKVDFPNYEYIDYRGADKYVKVGIILKYNEVKFSILIEKEGTIYYGIGRHNSTPEHSEEIKTLLRPLLGGFRESPWWYGWKDTSFQDGYYNLKSLIIEVEKLL